MKFYKITPLLYILFLLLLLFFPVVFFNKSLFFRDISVQDYPLLIYIVDSIKNFDFPLWNPFLFCGFPQMASMQPPLFYPLTYIYILFPFNVSMGIFLITHYFIAGLGIYFICRYWNFSYVSSLTGGLIFSLNSYIFELNSLQFILIATVWIPYIFLFAEKLMDIPEKKNFYLMMFFLCMQVSTGRLDYFYFTFVLVLFQISYRLITRISFPGQKPNTSEKLSSKFYKKIFLIISAFGLAFLVLSVQALPSLEFVSSTRRASGINFEAAEDLSVHPLQLLLLLFNNLFGDNFYSRGISPLASTGISFFIYNLYIGFPAFLLSLYSIIKKKQKTILLLFVFTFFLLISLGKYTPVFEFFYNYIPGFNMFRFPIKFFIFPVFCISLLAGIGMETFLNESDQKIFTVFSIISFGIVLLSVIVFSVFDSSFIDFFNHLLEKYSLSLKNIDFIKKSLFSSLLIITMFTITFYLYNFGKITGKNFGIFLILIIGFDLFNVNVSNLWLINKSLLYDNSPIGSELVMLNKNEKLYRILKPSEFSAPLIDRSKRLSDLKNNLYTLNYNISIKYSLYNAYGYYPGEPLGISYIFSALNDEIPGIKLSNKNKARLMKMLGVRFYIWHINNKSISPPDNKYFTLVKEYNHLFQIWEINDYQPRFSLKSKPFINNSDEIISQALLFPEQFGIDNDTVLISSELKEIFPAGIKESGNIIIKPRIKLISETNNKLFFEVNTPEISFFVVSNSYSKGWKCFVDNNEAPVLKANYCLQSIKLNKGSHKIEFKYLPDSFIIGRNLSILTIILLIASFMLSKLWKFFRE